VHSAQHSLEESINNSNRWIVCGDEELALIFKNPDNGEKVKLSILNSFFITGFFVFTGFIKLIILYLIQLKIKTAKEISVPDHLVIETIAPHHHLNYFPMFNKEGLQNYKLIKCFDKNQFTTICRLPFTLIISFFIENSKHLFNFLLKEMHRDVKSKIFKSTASNIAIYSYFCALLKYLKSGNPKIEIFHGGAVLFSLAARSIGIQTTLLSHGLVASMPRITMPRDDNIYVYSSEEKDYFEGLLIGSKIYKYPIEEVLKKEKKIIVFLNPDSRMIDTEIKRIEEVVTFFLNKNYNVLIKNHPIHDGIAGRDLCKLLGISPIEGNEDTSLLLSLEKPEFTISFHSTTICQSLDAGIIPICISEREKNHRDLFGSPYPIRRRAFFWKEEFLEVEKLFEGDDYSKALNKLRSR